MARARLKFRNFTNSRKVCVRARAQLESWDSFLTTAHYLNFTNEKQAERGSDLPMATKPGACFLVPTIVILGNKWPADG